MDTIVALATAPGRSAISVVRLTGSNSLTITRRLVSEPELQPATGHVLLKDLRSVATGEAIDRALLTFFKSPNSFTGEDVIEISCHGSPVIIREVIDSIISLGARLADPGEFSL